MDNRLASALWVMRIITINQLKFQSGPSSRASFRISDNRFANLSPMNLVKI
jgi:hypothetical protein